MQSIVNNKVSSLEIYSNANKAAHVAADSTKVYSLNKDSTILHEISNILMENTSDLHSKVESLRGLLSAQGYDIDSQSAETKKINKALAEISDLHSNIAATNKKALAGKPELSHLYNEISKRLDVIKYSIRDNSIATQHKVAKSKSAIPPVSKDTNNLTTGTSYADLWAVIAAAIGDIKTNYLDYYSGLLQKYEEMYQEYNNDVQKASSDAVTKGDDSNSVNFAKGTMEAGYKKFKDAVDDMDLPDVPGWKDMSSDQKTATINSLAPAFNVDDSGKVTFNLDQFNKLAAGADNGGGKLSNDQLNDAGITDNFVHQLQGFTWDDWKDVTSNFDDSTPDEIKKKLNDLIGFFSGDGGNTEVADYIKEHPGDEAGFKDMLRQTKNALADFDEKYGTPFPSADSDGKVSTPSYQAWLATFNASGSTLQSNMNSFTQRYSQANSTFDNLNKVLSGTISSLSDAAKDVLKSL